MSLGTRIIVLWSKSNQKYWKTRPETVPYRSRGSNGDRKSECQQQKLKEVTQQSNREQAHERKHIDKYQADT